MTVTQTLKRNRSMNNIASSSSLKKPMIIKNNSFLPQASKTKDIKTLNSDNFVAISNRLRNVAGLKNIKSCPVQNILYETDALLQTAKDAVKAFLETQNDTDFQLKGSPEYSGILALHLLKKQNPELSYHEIITKNLDSLTIDNCIAVLSSAFASRDAEYEDNKPSEITQESQHLISSFLPFGIDIFKSYFDKHPDLNPQRPRCDFSVRPYTLPLKDMHQEPQRNLTEAWEKRHEAPFKQRLEKALETIKKQHHLDLSDIKTENDIQTVWQNIREKDTKDYKISGVLFKALGGDWSRSEYIADEEKKLRTFPQEQWHINPFGTQYRQHKIGRGAMTALAPSENALQIAEKEIQKNLKPFKNLEDMMTVLKKIDNPIERFGLHAIFSNQYVSAGISGTSLKLMNLWDSIKRKNKSPDLPSRHDMEKLCYANLSGIKAHHSRLEIQMAFRNRRPTIE